MDDLLFRHGKFPATASSVSYWPRVKGCDSAYPSEISPFQVRFILVLMSRKCNFQTPPENCKKKIVPLALVRHQKPGQLWSFIRRYFSWNISISINCTPNWSPYILERVEVSMKQISLLIYRKPEVSMDIYNSYSKKLWRTYNTNTNNNKKKIIYWWSDVDYLI